MKAGAECRRCECQSESWQDHVHHKKYVCVPFDLRKPSLFKWGCVCVRRLPTKNPPNFVISFTVWHASRNTVYCTRNKINTEDMINRNLFSHQAQNNHLNACPTYSKPIKVSMKREKWFASWFVLTQNMKPKKVERLPVYSREYPSRLEQYRQLFWKGRLHGGVWTSLSASIVTAGLLLFRLPTWSLLDSSKFLLEGGFSSFVLFNVCL